MEIIKLVPTNLLNIFIILGHLFLIGDIIFMLYYVFDLLKFIIKIIILLSILYLCLYLYNGEGELMKII